MILCYREILAVTTERLYCCSVVEMMHKKSTSSNRNYTRSASCPCWPCGPLTQWNNKLTELSQHSPVLCVKDGSLGLFNYDSTCLWKVANISPVHYNATFGQLTSSMWLLFITFFVMLGSQVFCTHCIHTCVTEAIYAILNISADEVQ